MTEYRHFDTKRANGTYVTFERLLQEDHDADLSWCEPDELQRLRSGDLICIGIQARAEILIIENGVGTAHTMTSAGCWGVVVERSSDPYVTEVFEDECEALRCDMTAMARWKEVA